MEEEDFWEVCETFVTVRKDDKIIAEGRIHFQVYSNEWDAEDEYHDRQGHDDALIINGERYQTWDIEKDGYVVEWGDEREYNGTYETSAQAYDDFEKAIKGEIQYQQNSS